MPYGSFVSVVATLAVARPLHLIIYNNGFRVSAIRRYSMSEFLDLYDYRHRVAAMYRERTQAIMVGADPKATWQRFCAVRNELFAHHPQSPLDEEQRRHFQGLSYFPYNPALRFVVDIDTNVEPTRLTVVMNAEETMSMTTMGRVHFTVEGEPVALSLYWLNIYSGGLFLPVRDATCPAESYGG